MASNAYGNFAPVATRAPSPTPRVALATWVVCSNVLASLHKLKMHRVLLRNPKAFSRAYETTIQRRAGRKRDIRRGRTEMMSNWVVVYVRCVHFWPISQRQNQGITLSRVASTLMLGYCDAGEPTSAEQRLSCDMSMHRGSSVVPSPKGDSQ